MKTQLEKNLEDMLNLPVEQQIADEQVPVVIKNNDYEFARENLHDIIGKGSKALDELCDVANASQHPRAYEVVSTLIKTLSDANSNLLDIQKKKKDIEKEDDKGPNKVTNNLFVGSTADLQKIVNPRKVIDG
jgi:hypothetical protein|tara:strand:- start:31 stop:426 length:396 start_codon:yes stop_codon:yes gene_type:complete